jgi:arsenate reductase-like glutaredoxin family protein
MDNKKDELRDLFRSNLQQMQVVPPDHVWDNIASAMRRKKRTLYFWYSAAAVALLLLSIIPGSYLFQHVSEQPSVAIESPRLMNSSSDVINKTTKLEKQIEVLSDLKSNTYSLNVQSNKSNIKRLESQISLDNEEVVNDFQELINQNEDQITSAYAEDLTETSNLASDNQRLSEQERMARIRLAQQMIKRPNDFVLEDEKRTDAYKQEKMNIALAYGSVPGGTVTANELLYENTNVKYRNDAFQSDMAYETSFYEEIERTDIRPPLTFGLKFNYKISKRFSLETGITYTSLSVLTKTVLMEDIHSEYLRTLYYLGLPLGVRWDILQTKRIVGYLQQSVMVEKGIRAVNRSMRFEKGVLFESDQNGMRIPGFQLSTLSSLGCDVNLYQNFSVYGEAGLQIFYLNSTQPFNLRSAKMTWPVFQTGVRMNF